MTLLIIVIHSTWLMHWECETDETSAEMHPDRGIGIALSRDWVSQIQTLFSCWQTTRHVTRGTSSLGAYMRIQGVIWTCMGITLKWIIEAMKSRSKTLYAFSQVCSHFVHGIVSVVTT